MRRTKYAEKTGLLVTAGILLAAMAACSGEYVGNDAAVVEEIPETWVTVQASTEPAEEPLEAATVPVTEPPVVLHSGLREDGSFDEGTLFLGDSLTCMLVGSYLTPYDLIGDAKYATMCGSKVTAFFDEDFRMGCHPTLYSGYSEEFEGMAFYEAAAAMGNQATAIYMMWGTNYEPEATTQTYIELVDYLLAVCPNATVHMQLIPYGNVPYREVNPMVEAAHAHYVETGEQRVLLIDTFTAIDKFPVDGVHQGEPGNRRWYNAIVEHARENDLEQ